MCFSEVLCYKDLIQCLVYEGIMFQKIVGLRTPPNTISNEGWAGYGNLMVPHMQVSFLLQNKHKLCLPLE